MNTGSFVLLRWEISVFLRSKILLFWNFAFPILIFFVLVSAFGGPTSLGSVELRVADADHTAASAAYVDALRAALTTNEAVSATITTGGAATADPGAISVEIPAGFADALGGGKPAQVSLTYDASSSVAQRAAVHIIRGVTTEFELGSLAGRGMLRLLIADTSGGKRDISYRDYLATGIVVMTLLSICTIGLIVPLVVRRESNELRTLQCLPLRREALMAAFVGSRLLICVVFALLFLCIVSPFYHLNIALSPASVARALFLVLAGALVFCSIGLAIAGRLRSVVVANAAANVIYFPLVFLGNLMIPVRGFSMPVQHALSYTPGSALVTALRHVVLDNAALTAQWPSLLILAVWGLIAAVVASRFFVWDRT